jgi:SAM-dependent methyltransferase
MTNRPPILPTSDPSALWGRGEYGVIGQNLQVVADMLCSKTGIGNSDTVLDIGTGTGNAAIAAARQGCRVVGVDVSPELLDQARRRAQQENLEIEFIEADALNLPFEDSAFDAVLSTFGIMFAAPHAAAASEMFRVCRSGGKIGLANWAPDGVFGATGKVTAEFLPTDPDSASPAAWGGHAYLESLIGTQAEFENSRQRVIYEYPGVDEYMDTLINSYPPTINTFAKLDGDRQAELRERLSALYQSWNLAADGRFCMPMDYLETIGRKI